MSDQQGMQEGAAGQSLTFTSNSLKPKVTRVEQDPNAMAALASVLGPSERPQPLAVESVDVGQGDTAPVDIDGVAKDLAAHVPATSSSDALETSAASIPALEGDSSEESFAETVRRLEALPPLEYEQARKAESRRLGVRATALDHAVKDARQAMVAIDPVVEVCPTVEPWEEPLNAAHVLDETLATIKRHIACEDNTSILATLFIAFTWFIDSFQVAPIAVIMSPLKRCGKSWLLEVMGKLSRRPLLASNLTSASIFQAIEAFHPTLLIDETDSFLKKNEQMRGVLNSGHTRASAFVLRAGRNSDTPRKFSTFGAKVLSGIGKLAETIMDRAVVLKLRRKTKVEKVQPLRHADPDHFTTLARKLARLAEDNGPALRSARPQIPESLNDRAQDNWEPLFAIAELAGEEWVQAARNAAVLAADDDDESDIPIMLLRDIQAVFDEIRCETIRGKQVKRIKTEDLLNELAADCSRPWATYNRGKIMTAKHLAELLAPFGIRPANIKRPGNKSPKGYRLDQFEETFSRYLTANLDEEDDPGQDGAENPPCSRYPATSENPCGSSVIGSTEVADAMPLLPEQVVVGGDADAATCVLPKDAEPATALEGSGVAAESDHSSNDAGADSPGGQVLAGEALDSAILPRRRGRPRKALPESLQETSVLVLPEQNHGAGSAAEVPSPTDPQGIE